MDVILEMVCGLDVHKDVIVACMLSGTSRTKKELRSFSAFRDGLEQLRDWVREKGCTHVAMESTGSYWLPVYEVLEEAGVFELVVCNAQHVKKVPGRKTDVGDAEWLAKLVRAGLLRKSFVPPQDIRDLRDLMRTRRSFVRAQADERNRVAKLLQTAQIKIDSVATDLFGLSGLTMLRAIAAGETDPRKLADLARGKLRKKLEPLARALAGRVREHHRYLLTVHLEALDQSERRIAGLDQRIEKGLRPYTAKMEKLRKMPGIEFIAAATIIAETGARMEVFGSPERLASYAGVCPGNNQSAGKPLGGKGRKARKGNEFLTTILFESAVAAVRKKGSAFKAKYHSLLHRLGSKKKALMAIAHKLLRVIYRLLSSDDDYREYGDQPSAPADRQRQARRLLKRLRALDVDLSNLLMDAPS